jgi:hypothetical protein
MNPATSQTPNTLPASPLANFLQAYETNSSTGNVTALLTQFADPFMAAGPTGVQCLRAADMAAALPKRLQLFAGLGAQPSKLVSCQETRLDERFIMAETRWQMTFIREGQPTRQVMADSLFILDTAADTPKIILYIAHQDLVANLREQGILPVFQSGN